MSNLNVYLKYMVAPPFCFFSFLAECPISHRVVSIQAELILPFAGPFFVTGHYRCPANIYVHTHICIHLCVYIVGNLVNFKQKLIDDLEHFPCT